MAAFLKRKWDAFWYEPSSATSLAICRVLFFAAFLLYFLRVDHRELADLPPGIWTPLWPLGLGLSVPSAAALDVLQWLWRVCMLSACLGLATRWSTAGSFILGTYLIALPQHLAKLNHSDAIVVFGLATMTLARCGDELSVDAWLRRRRANSISPPLASGEYTWPVRTMWLVFVLIYFSAGVTKLRTSGIGWATSDHLANLLMLAPLTRPAVTTVGQQIGTSHLLSSFLAGTALLIELSAPLALVNRTARTIVISALFTMQLSIRLLMGPGFTEFFVCGLFWVPWDAVIERMKLFAAARHFSNWAPLPAKR